MKCLACGLYVAVFALFSFPNVAYPQTYYVDAANGNDSNNGRSSTSAWKTIQQAADHVKSGNAVLVVPGTYAERVRISASGTSNAPIRFNASASGTVVHGLTLQDCTYVVIEGFEITIPQASALDDWDVGSGVSLINTQYCEIRNNHIHHTLREGIMLFTNAGEDSAASSHNTIAGNTIEYAGAYAGITVNGAAQTLDGNEISHSVQHPLWPQLSTADGADADGIKFRGRDHLIRGNYIHDITLADTGNTTPHIDAFQTYGPAYGIVFERNRVELSTDSEDYQVANISQNVAPTENLAFRYNVFTAYRGLNIWGRDDSTNEVVPLRRVFIANNTFYGIKDYDIELHDCPESQVKNNAIAAGSRYLWANADPDVSHNAVPAPLALYPNDKRVDAPLYADPQHGDFHLQSNSPLIDTGTDVGLTSDFDGAVVPQRGNVDIGAFEFTDPAIECAASGGATPSHQFPPLKNADVFLLLSAGVLLVFLERPHRKRTRDSRS